MCEKSEQICKPTPGPWTAHWSKYRDGVFVVQAAQPSNRILASFDGDGDGPDEQSLADAHLIATAPDLLWMMIIDALSSKALRLAEQQGATS